jgi:hypothetical protein
VLAADQNDLVLAFLRWSDDVQSQTLVIANLQEKPLANFAVHDPLLADGPWRDALSETQVAVNDHALSVSLAPSQVMILCYP